MKLLERKVIAGCLGRAEADIEKVTLLEKGMTNQSLLIDCGDQRYIMRVPGAGTRQLISRQQEAAVYRLIAGQGLCDDVVYIDPATGYKITRYIDNVRSCDPENEDDLNICMEKLRSLHARKLQVGHEFDIFEKIEFYEKLWDGAPSMYGDYARTKEAVLALRPYIEAHTEGKCLAHIDSVSDNFLFSPAEGGGERVQLIDWEYAGMQDPHVDIAMFCIYDAYDKGKIDRLIDIYFQGGCPTHIRVKIYCYVAACGLLWSNWCEYKRSLGQDFGEYALRQYRFAADYCRIAREEMTRHGLT